MPAPAPESAENFALIAAALAVAIPYVTPRAQCAGIIADSLVEVAPGAEVWANAVPVDAQHASFLVFDQGSWRVLDAYVGAQRQTLVPGAATFKLLNGSVVVPGIWVALQVKNTSAVPQRFRGVVVGKAGM